MSNKGISIDLELDGHRVGFIDDQLRLSITRIASVSFIILKLNVVTRREFRHSVKL